MSTGNGTSGHLQYSDERLGDFLVGLGEIAVELGVLNEEVLETVLKPR